MPAKRAFFGDPRALPKTKKDAQATGSRFYFSGTPCKNGHVFVRRANGSCLMCGREYSNTPQRIEYNRRYAESGQRARVRRQHYIANKDQYYESNRRQPLEKRREYRKRWEKENREYRRAKTNERRRRNKKATPAWLTADEHRQIAAIYKQAAALNNGKAKYAVDHIYPIRGRDVCGLHVPWNLQILDAAENARKNNKPPGPGKEIAFPP
jgi:hypothetical protein